MNNVLKSALLASLTVGLFASPVHCLAQQPQRQNRGNVDPQQARQRMMDRYREQLEVKNDADWNVLEPRIQKVMDARREVAQGGMGGAMFGRGRGGANNAQGGDQAQSTRRARQGNNNAQGDQAQPTRRAPQLSAAGQALQEAIKSNASADDLKAKLASYREERKEKQAKLEAAQADLQKILSLKQESTAVLMGLLQ
jgi:hypothetical protein